MGPVRMTRPKMLFIDIEGVAAGCALQDDIEACERASAATYKYR